MWKAAGERKQSVGVVLAQARALADHLVELCNASPPDPNAAVVTLSRRVLAYSCVRLTLQQWCRHVWTGIVTSCQEGTNTHTRACNDSKNTCLALGTRGVVATRIVVGCSYARRYLCRVFSCAFSHVADHAALLDDDAKLHAFNDARDAPRFVSVNDKVQAFFCSTMILTRARRR